MTSDVSGRFFILLYAARNRTRSNFKMAVFDSCLRSSLHTELPFKSKTEQNYCLHNIFNLKDTIAFEFDELRLL